MSGISGLLNNALSGLQVSQVALQTTGNNIANVNTPGYSRETAVPTTLPPTYIGGQFLGNGAQIQTITRAYDSYLQSQVWSSTAATSASSALNAQLQQISNLLASPQGGLSSQLNQFFSGVAQVAANPADLPSRQSMVSQAQSLAQTFQSLGGQLQTLADGVNQQIGQSVTSINSLTQQIADLNRQISTLSGAGNGNPNNLLDQRDQLISRLNAQVGVSVLPQANGQINVFTGNGQVLVAGTQSYALKTTPGTYDQGQLEVAYAANGAVISQGLSVGALGGLLQFRATSLAPAQNALGRIADGIAAEFNLQQSKGIDLNGNFGQALFQGGPVQVLGSQYNTGSGTISGSITDVTQLTTADYKLQDNGGTWSVTNLSTGQAVSGSALSVSTSGSVTTLAFDGVQVNVSGAASGDSFLVEPTRLGASALQATLTDPSGIAAAAPYAASAGVLQSNGSIVNNNLGNLVLSAGAWSASSGGATLVIGAVVNTPLQITLTSGGTSGQSVGFQITASGSATVLASGSVTLGSSGTTLAIPYGNNPPGGYWETTLSGSLAASGDAYVLTAAGPGNNANAQAMSALQSGKFLSNGSTSFENSYAQLVSQVATAANQSQTALAANQAVAQQATAAQQSVSGVNLDQEAANLVQYQQAYQAAAKAISVGASLFQSLLQAL